MTLSSVAKELGQRNPATQTLSITGIQDDSRSVRPGDLFVAVRGIRTDGHEYAVKAISLGAIALVLERPLNLGVPEIIVPNTAKALGILAAFAQHNPSNDLCTIGITGTNGKTTTSYILEAILDSAGQSTGLLGTVSYRYGGKEYPAIYTTPTPLVLQDTLAQIRDAACQTAILEISSAALTMDRLEGTHFQVAAFSNLTQDHLDVHETMEEYARAKSQLFSNHLSPSGVAVVNIDDPASHSMIAACKGKTILRVSSNPKQDAEIKIQSFESTIAGIVAKIKTPRGLLVVTSSALIGHYNVENLALAIAIAEALNIPHKAMIEGLKNLKGVPGRVERVRNDSQLNILVDYAHTPDALSNVLSALRPLTAGRLLCVFGCGGDRDPSKREAMGKAVTEAADLAFVTSDNPRTECPQNILDMITPFVPDAFFIDTDRRMAIQAAILEATPHDIVLIAGKGHEDYQIIGTKKLHFDDREEALHAVSLRPSFSAKQIVDDATGAILLGEQRSTFSRVIIDSRQAAPGDLYVAIQGEKYDGHDFCQQAIDAGATGVLVETGRGSTLTGACVLEVSDPRYVLGQIACRHRKHWQGQVIGITGSAGKTTTKELLAAALSQTGRVHAAKGSNNNETGVPLTLLGLTPFHHFAVIEMGMRALGEIDYLAKIALPNVSVVTNAGTAHIGILGSTDAIAKAKAEIYGDHRGPGIAIFPANDKRLRSFAEHTNQYFSFGEAQTQADLVLSSYQAHGMQGATLKIEYKAKKYKVELPLVGIHNATNAICALLSAVAAGAQIEDAIKAIEKVKVPSLRSELRTVAGRHLYIDCYNANPSSMKAALLTLADLSAGHRPFAILGDMLELGPEGKNAHWQIGKLAAELNIQVIALGTFRSSIVSGVKDNHGSAWDAPDYISAARFALSFSRPDDWILLKASRGMKLEKVVEAIQKETSSN